MFNLSTFYQSKEWGDLLRILKQERVNEMGFIICEHCGRPIVKKYDCIGHHKEELTAANVNDVGISLNPDNIALVHHKCHNAIHERFGYEYKKIYIVHGAPCSGKTSYVREVAGAEDIVLDIDNIWQCISTNDRYVKPNRLKPNVFNIRDTILDQILTGLGYWRNAYIIGGYPYEAERERMRSLYGAELIHIDTDAEECLKRAAERPPEYAEYVQEYFDKFQSAAL